MPTMHRKLRFTAEFEIGNSKSVSIEEFKKTFLQHCLIFDSEKPESMILVYLDAEIVDNKEILKPGEK